MKKHLWAICFSLVIVAFTTYIALDTFVLASSYNENATEMNISMFAEPAAAETEQITLEAQPETQAEVQSETQTEVQQEAQTEIQPEQNETLAASSDPNPPVGTDAESVAADKAENSDSTTNTDSADSVDGTSGASERQSGSASGEASWGGRSSSSSRSRGSSGSSSWGGRSSDYDSNDNTDDTSEWSGSSGRSGSSSWGGRSSDYDSSDSNDDTSEWSGSSGRSSRSGRGGFMNSAESAEGVDASAEYTGDRTYSDDNVTITLTEYNQNSTRIYVADVTVTSTQYIKSAFAKDTYGKNVTESTSAMAAAHDAILAVNGDYYGAQERGYVIRNGIVYRGTSAGKDVMCVYADGTMGIVSDKEYTADELVASGVWQALSFGPALVKDGEIAVGVNSEVGKGMVSNPRTAVGMIDTNHFVFVVADGRTYESEGLSLYGLAQFMQSLGVKTAYNLDGGGSSTMYFNGQVVNNPTSWGGDISERGVSDIVYVG